MPWYCRQFLSNFGHIYTLNYDVLLYWALMQDQVDELDLLPDDGFRSPEDDHDAPYVTWQEADQAKVHYLHGSASAADISKIKTKATLMSQQRATKSPRKPLDIHFFSAESAQVWG